MCCWICFEIAVSPRHLHPFCRKRLSISCFSTLPSTVSLPSPLGSGRRVAARHSKPSRPPSTETECMLLTANNGSMCMYGNCSAPTATVICLQPRVQTVGLPRNTTLYRWSSILMSPVFSHLAPRICLQYNYPVSKTNKSNFKH